MDKEMDKDSSLNHTFLDQRAQLLDRKIANPAARVQAACELAGHEQVKISEAKRQGLKAPKKKFMTMKAFRKKWPHKALDPSQIRTHYVDGDKVEGVDVIASEAMGRYGMKPWDVFFSHT